MELWRHLSSSRVFWPGRQALSLVALSPKGNVGVPVSRFREKQVRMRDWNQVCGICVASGTNPYLGTSKSKRGHRARVT